MRTKHLQVLSRHGAALLSQLRTHLLQILGPTSVEIEGVKILLGSHISRKIRDAIYSRAYERAEIEILKSVLTENDRVFEVGSGIGFLTTYIASAIGSDKVRGYEANPELIPRIEANLRLNRVQPVVINGLLRNTSGDTRFFVEENFWSSSTHKRSPAAREISVPSIPLNEEIRKYSPSLLIVDIEGGEAEFFVDIDFHTITKIIVEMHPHVIGAIAVSEVIKRIERAGFSMDQCLSQGGVYFFGRLTPFSHPVLM